MDYLKLLKEKFKEGEEAYWLHDKFNTVKKIKVEKVLNLSEIFCTYNDSFNLRGEIIDPQYLFKDKNILLNQLKYKINWIKEEIDKIKKHWRKND